MFKEHYSLYKDCFPDYPLSYEDFSSMTDIDNAKVFEERKKDKLIGFAIVGKQNISVIAVDKNHRRKGVGEGLLKLSEEHLINSGIRKI
ncbi:MAG: GNAT family N-acetyltransferase, partial [Ruminiclostridium sp.]|nr:GNAT family N-acetyltransferase [Ruminiclostridium sp.]